MVFVFSLLLFPVFFLMIFAAAEYLFPTRNSALIFSLAAGLLLSGTYYLLRCRAKEKSEKKRREKLHEKTRLLQVMLMSPEDFSSFFPEETLCDNGCVPLSSDALLSFLRKHPKQNAVVINAVNGISDQALALAHDLRLDLAITPTKEILSALPEDKLPKTADVPECKGKERLMRAVKTTVFEKNSRRIGMFFLFFSLWTPYKLYYSLCGSFLIALSLIIRHERKHKDGLRARQSTKSNSRSPI